MREGNIFVQVKEKETVDRALKRFKKKIDRVGILKKVRSKMYHKKASVTRREQRLKAIYKQHLQHKEYVS